MGTTDSLRRQLGLTSATALIVGEVIGLGIFLTPSQMAVALGSPLWILVVWHPMMGVMTLCGAALLRRAGRSLPGGRWRLRLSA